MIDGGTPRRVLFGTPQRNNNSCDEGDAVQARAGSRFISNDCENHISPAFRGESSGSCGMRKRSQSRTRSRPRPLQVDSPNALQLDSTVCRSLSVFEYGGGDDKNWELARQRASELAHVSLEIDRMIDTITTWPIKEEPAAAGHAAIGESGSPCVVALHSGDSSASDNDAGVAAEPQEVSCDAALKNDDDGDASVSTLALGGREAPSPRPTVVWRLVVGLLAAVALVVGLVFFFRHFM